jgi:hypothetical protein
MTTKPPSAVEPSAAASLESIAYASVSAIRTQEPNDRNRLGYHVWRFLTSREGTLEQAVHESGARLLIPGDEATAMIRDSLHQQGITA